MSKNVDVAVIGAGSAGLRAFRQARQAGANAVLINAGAYGTTCARVGCMPSKVLIEVAKTFAKKSHFKDFGIQGSEQLNLDRTAVMNYVRSLRNRFVGRVMQSVEKINPEYNIAGQAKFIAPQILEVNGEQIQAKKIVIATGSHPVMPSEWSSLGDKVITTDQLFELETLPDSLAVIGLGTIGCEIGQALARLGVKVVGIEMLSNIAGLTDPIVNQAAIEVLAKDFELRLETKTQLSADASGQVLVKTGDGQSVKADKVLVSLGRSPNFDNLDIEKVYDLDFSQGFKGLVNPNTMQLANLPIFVAGDVNAFRAILHEAADDGIIAGTNAAKKEVSAFERRVPLRIAFTDPQITIVGATFEELKKQDILIGERNFAMQGRTRIMARPYGQLRLYAEAKTGLLLGSEMFIPDGEYVGHFLAMAIEHKMTIQDILRTPFYHPTIMEGLEDALKSIASKMSTTIEPILLKEK